MHDKNIYCILYNEQLDCLITGGEDRTIQLHYLGGIIPTFNDVPLPTSFQVGPSPSKQAASLPDTIILYLWGQFGLVMRRV